MKTNKIIYVNFFGRDIRIPVGIQVMSADMPGRFLVADLSFLPAELFALARDNGLYVSENDVDILE